MRLEVKHCDARVGWLDDSTGKVLFQYAPEWLRDGKELSPFYLPLQQGVIPMEGPFEGGLAGLFADSLPDYWGRSIMDRRLREMGVNPATVSVLKRLAMVGQGGLGALSYLPAESEDRYEFKTLADAVRFSRDVLRLNAGELPGSTIMQQAGSNPAGRYPKLCVGWQPDTGDLVIGTQCYPEGFVPCLLKLDLGDEMPQGAKNLCKKEHDLLDAAERCGLNVPKRWLLSTVESDGRLRQHLLLQRFDRVGERRIHLHSFSGIAHKLSVRYGASYEELLRVVSALTKDQRQIDEMFRRMVFNVIFGNRDDHVRNHAFIMDASGDWQLSPAYDLTPTPQLQEQTLSVNGKWESISESDLLRVGEAFDVSQAAEIIETVMAAENAR